MPTHLLDTNIVSFSMLSRYAHLQDRLETALLNRSAVISAVTRAELRAGQARLSPTDRRYPAIGLLISRLPCLPWTQQAADAYGALDAELRAAGTPIGILDTQIAAHALAEDLILVTHNIKHFERVSGLPIENWA
jgi:tRNA(fMet)-specific endonuclease VapC